MPTPEEIGFDCIVTNPPFSLKTEFLEKCYRIGKPFALLLPITALDTRARQAMFKQNGVEIILIGRRINFEYPKELKGKLKGSGAYFECAWFTHGLRTGKQIVFPKAALHSMVT